MRTPLLHVVSLLLLAGSASAQGTLSGQGFGFPPGQLSTRSLASGGALADFDPQTPLNPASIRNWGPGGLYFVVEPEYRTVTVGDEEDATHLTRFPLIATGLQIGERWNLGVSASTLMDRTGSSSAEVTQAIGGEEVTSTNTFRSSGAVNDIRLALAHGSTRFRLGAGVHALTGRNVLDFEVQFHDSVAFLPFRQQSTLNYGGLAASAGMEWRPVSQVAIAASGRVGGTIRAYRGDTLISEATAPARAGASIGYFGFRGAVLAARVDWTGWSSISELGREGLVAHDALEVSVGGEIQGPRLINTAIPLRAGFRRRTLPFEAAGEEVTETALAGGFGIPLRLNRSNVDVTLQRASRTVDGGLRERSWIFSLALTVRP